MNVLHDKWFEFWHTFWDFGHFTTELSVEAITAGVAFAIGRGWFNRLVIRHDAEHHDHTEPHEDLSTEAKRKAKEEWMAGKGTASKVLMPQGNGPATWTYITFSSNAPSIIWAWSTNRSARKVAHRAYNNIPVQGPESGRVKTLCGQKIGPKFARTSAEHPSEDATNHDCERCLRRERKLQ